jgi:sulfur-oxidizing protein SoxX
MKTSHKISLAALLAAAAVAGCASGGMPGAMTGADIDKLTADIARASFRDEGIVKADKVLDVDATLRACNAADVAGKPLDEKTARALEAENLKTVKWPSDGKYLGDWRSGEQLAQSGRGMTFTDTAKTANGGNCYNCHQIDKKEISFGTIGPSLYQYGKLRGVTDANSPAARETVQYTWGKIWNSKAYNACSNMPRAGHMGILTEAQVADIVALLLDPKSPVNQ